MPVLLHERGYATASELALLGILDATTLAEWIERFRREALSNTSAQW
ncbi:hypothetical protein [Cerasicoccus arenae]|nr:hypothetical protein [Cerasicoccus arenae]